MTDTTQATEMTDGFHLVIDALKHNDIDTIFGLVGIPITDLCRLAQAHRTLPILPCSSLPTRPRGSQARPM